MRTLLLILSFFQQSNMRIKRFLWSSILRECHTFKLRVRVMSNLNRVRGTESCHHRLRKATEKVILS